MMKKIERAEVLDLVEYEKAREGMRARVIALKKNRRVGVGENLTFLFENRETVLFQIQEMVRTERIVDDSRVQEEVDAYNALIPSAGELSATLFIEIPDLHLMGHDQVREAVNRFQGIDKGGVTLQVGDAPAIPAFFEDGHSKEEKMAAVHYLRFRVPVDVAARLAAGDPARLVVEHPRYKAEALLPQALRAELQGDLDLAPVSA
jgi:Protein of unknown function (DUF3501)